MSAICVDFQPMDALLEWLKRNVICTKDGNCSDKKDCDKKPLKRCFVLEVSLAVLFGFGLFLAISSLLGGLLVLQSGNTDWKPKPSTSWPP